MMSFENCALVPTLIIKRIPDHIRPGAFPLGSSTGKSFSKTGSWSIMFSCCCTYHTSSWKMLRISSSNIWVETLQCCFFPPLFHLCVSQEKTNFFDLQQACWFRDFFSVMTFVNISLRKQLARACAGCPVIPHSNVWMECCSRGTTGF